MGIVLFLSFPSDSDGHPGLRTHALVRGQAGPVRKWKCSDSNHEKNRCKTDSTSVCLTDALLPLSYLSVVFQAAQNKRGDFNIKNVKAAPNLQIDIKQGL